MSHQVTIEHLVEIAIRDIESSGIEFESLSFWYKKNVTSSQCCKEGIVQLT